MGRERQGVLQRKMYEEKRETDRGGYKQKLRQVGKMGERLGEIKRD